MLTFIACMHMTIYIAEDNLCEVKREVVKIQAHYYEFGIELGLPLQEMETIKRSFQQDIPGAFTEVLVVWLQHRYNWEKYGLPTWRRLVEAVNSPAGGNNHALAKTIAQHLKEADNPTGSSHALAEKVVEHHLSGADCKKKPSSESTHAMAKNIAKYHLEGIVISASNVPNPQSPPGEASGIL